MPTQPQTPEFPLSTQLARVKVPQYLFPPGITIAELSGSEPLFPLVINYDEIKPNVMGQPEFIDKHAEISQKYLEANFPDFTELNDEERKKISHDYSHHFVIELLVYQALAKGAENHEVAFSFKNTLESITEDLTFPNFLSYRLSETLKKTHPMYSQMNKLDVDNAISVRPIVNEDGQDSILISIDDPQAIQNDVRNNKIRDMMKEKLATFDVAQQLDIYLHSDKQHEFIRSLPLFF
mgnify:CR=1 FL=1